MVNSSRYAMSERIDRVFYHELGHFVARELNKEYYSGKDVKQIILHPCDQKRDLYCGQTDVEKEEEKSAADQQPTRKELAEILASIMYGCMFQSYFMKQAFVDCLIINGREDLQTRLSALNLHKLFWHRSSFTEIEDAYFEDLVKDLSLEKFRVSNPDEYLNEYADNQYLVNIEKLCKDLKPAFDAHADLYKKFVSQLENVIAEKLKEVEANEGE